MKRRVLGTGVVEQLAAGQNCRCCAKLLILWLENVLLAGFCIQGRYKRHESPAIRIAKELLEEGAQLSIYDPKVSPGQIQRIGWCPPSKAEACWQQSADPLIACQGADAVLVLTEWDQFSTLDWHGVAAVMRRPAWLFDTRAVVNWQRVQRGCKFGLLVRADD